jgi:tetratricopeptide (TPR) repeat protein
MSAVRAAADADEALRLVDVSPRRALELGLALARQARAGGALDAASVAERAAGRALQLRGDLDNAIRHLRAAVRLGQRAGSAELVAQARVSLAAALVERGRPRAALDAIHAAVDALDGTQRAMALAQLGAILLDLGRYGAAVDSYRTALPILRQAGDLMWVKRSLTNRGLAHAYLHDFAAAEADLREAERLSVELDLGLSVGFAQANLGFVLARAGDVPAALDYFRRAERRIRAHGAQIGRLLQDRGELLLSVRLVAEARETAEQALLEYRKERRVAKLADVHLILAHAAALDGDGATALHHARQAARAFGRQGRTEWAAYARLAAVRAEQVVSGRPPAAGRLERLADTLTAARWPAAALDAHLAAGQALLARSEPERGRAHLATAAAARRRRGPATLRARGWYAEALRRSSLGDAAGAGRAIRAGLAVLDTHHAALGATDLRARAAGHREELARLGLRGAMRGGRPRQVFEWAETGRASHLLMPPLRPPDDPELAAALARLRATAFQGVEVARTEGAAAEMIRLEGRQAALERAVRERTWRRRGDVAPAAGTPVKPAALAQALAGRALVEFIELDGTLSALTAVDGRLRLHRLGPADQVGDLLDRILFALRMLVRAAGSPDGADPQLALLRHAAGKMDAFLLGGLAELGDRPLVLVPTGRLLSLPWSVLPSCHGRPVTVSPSATLWHLAATRPADPPGHVLAVAGPELPGAGAEADAVAAVYGGASVQPPQSTVDKVLAGLNGAALAHLAAHGRLSADNPLFSSLLMADGPLMVYDLERLGRAPHTVVLAACESARPVVYAGDELLGVSSTLLVRGTTQVVASVLPVLDVETAPFMTAFHRLLAAGEAPAVALARIGRDAAGAAEMAVAAGFVCIGAGFAPIPRAVALPRPYVRANQDRPVPATRS